MAEIDQVAKPNRIVVVGDTVIDHYHAGTARKLDQTSAVPCVNVDLEYHDLGGAANAALGVAALAAPVSLVSVIGTLPAKDVIFPTRLPGQLELFVGTHEAYTSPQKHRVYSHGRLVCRFDTERISKELMTDVMIGAFEDCVAKYMPLVILLSDYNKGACTPELIRFVIDYGIANDIPVIVDPSPVHFEHYHGATTVCPNGAEACAVFPERDPALVAEGICTKFAVKQCVITCGSRGAVVCDHGDVYQQPAFPAFEMDACGAGDTVAACLAYACALGLPLKAAVYFAMAGGSASVEHTGCRRVPLYDIHRRMTDSDASTKHVSLEEALLLRTSAMLSDSPVGITNGVFDFLHPGHLSLLQEAATTCEFLIVLLNSDASATRIKRAPINDEAARIAMLSAIEHVDAIVVFDGDTPAAEIQKLTPNVLVKSEQYKDTVVPGAAIVEETDGCRMHFAKHVQACSTTNIIERIQTVKDAKAKVVTPSATADRDDSSDGTAR